MKLKTITLFLFITFYGTLFAQQKETYSLQELQRRFKHELYTEKALLAFQNTMVQLREKPQLHEAIPGKVLTWFTLNGRYSMHKTYLVHKDSVQEVEPLPKDAIFLKKLNSYVPEKSRFTYGYDLWSFPLVTQIQDDGFYIIKATAKSFNSHPDLPNDDILLYDLEYKTKDFKSFQLVRLKDIHTEKWIDVENY